MKYHNTDYTAEKLVEIAGHNVLVKYWFDGGEPEVRYYADGSGHPATGATLEVLEYWLDGKEITNVIGDLSEGNIALSIMYDEDELSAYGQEKRYDKALLSIICAVLNEPTLLDSVLDRMLTDEIESFY